MFVLLLAYACFALAYPWLVITVLKSVELAPRYVHPVLIVTLALIPLAITMCGGWQLHTRLRARRFSPAATLLAIAFAILLWLALYAIQAALALNALSGGA